MPETGVAPALPGFLAVGDGGARPPSFDAWEVPTFGGEDRVVVLSRVTRSGRGEVTPADLADRLAGDWSGLSALLPPFAVAVSGRGAVRMLADSMGFRPLYLGRREGCAAMSTSAILAARAIGAGLDRRAVAVQSLLGWQLGQRTLLEGVAKLAPGAEARLDSDGLHTTTPDLDPDATLGLDEAVPAAARLLRESLEALLDDHPDAVLQLTGGQDSRLLLSAIPPSRRRGLAAMTLGAPDSGDVVVASALADRWSLKHEVRGLGPLADVDAEQAWSLCIDASASIDAMADPVALAALGVGERQFDQGVRISGLGGEVARGFYYLGRVRDRPVSRDAARRLGDWRMFVNEAVEPGLLRPEFGAWARDAAHDDLFEAVSGGGAEWFRATDHLYLVHRMQRWAGLTDMAVGYRRIVINPMLDHDFVRIARRLAPADKAASRFLGRLQVELDAELARMPLEGRPAPRYYAYPGPAASVQRTLADGRRALAKAGQRVRGRNRPPAGGAVFAGKVVAYWRSHPEVLGPLGGLDFLDQGWIERMLAGEVEPRPTSVALLTNLFVALTGVTRPGDTPAQG